MSEMGFYDERQPIGVPMEAIPLVDNSDREYRERGGIGPRRTFTPYFDGDEWAPASWGSEKIARLQRTMFDAGVFGRDEKFQLGVWDPTTVSAYRRLLAYSNATALPASAALEDWMNRAAQFGLTGEQLAARVVPGSVGGANVYELQLPDPASLRQGADAISRRELGRKATAEEQTEIIADIHSKQRAQFGAEMDARESQSRAAFDAGVAQNVDLARRQVSAEQTATPGAAFGIGGTDSVTSEYVLGVGQQLAEQFGLKITSHKRSAAKNKAVKGAKNSDHLWGGAVDLAGTPQQMAALADWARANTGPGKMFRYVEYGTDDHKDHVHLSFNKGKVPGAGANIPAIPVTGPGGVTVQPSTYIAPKIVESVQVDPEARIEEYLRQKNPGEAQGHDLAQQFSVFSRMITGAL